jgi:hypothetical protein
MRAMVEQLVADFESTTLAIADTDPEPVGRVTRAVMMAMTSPHLATVGRALLAAVVHDPSLLDPLRALYDRSYARLLDDGIEPVDALLCQLAGDAVWKNAIFGLPAVPARAQGPLKRRLLALTRGRRPG